MRRTLSALVVLAGSLAFGAGVIQPAHATVVATCALSNYTLTGNFNRVGGANTNFSLVATGDLCEGTSTAVTVSLTFKSAGPWSCSGGAATGTGGIFPEGAPSQSVVAELTNVGGEYVLVVQNNAAAVGQATTLPIPCDLGQTQTTVGGFGTVTYAA
jgi:hypothetical protein